MNCVRCSGPIELSQKHCAHCGVPLNADKKAVLDAIERLVEAKAHAIVAADRAREQREQQAQREREEHDKLVRELTEAREALEKVQRTPRRIWALSRMGAGLIALSALILGVPFTCVVGSSLHRSLPGEVLCQYVCDGCSAPARVIGWSRTVDGNRSDHFRTFCSHPTVEFQSLRSVEALEGSYNWIELPWWQETLFSFGVWFLSGVAVLPFVYAWRERKWLAAKERRLPAQIAGLERALAATEPPAPAQHYR